MSEHYPIELSAPVTIADQVYLLLEREILSGRIPGGSRLRVRQLADFAGTSIMPVRDAIRRLERDGLAISRPNKGARAKEFSAPEFRDIYAIRILLEPEAAALGVASATAECIAEMERQLALLSEAYEAGRVGDAIAADTGLLRTLYACAGNELLSSMIESLWKQSHLYRITAMDNDTDRQTYRRNSLILEAARIGNAEAARTTSQEAIAVALTKLTSVSENRDATHRLEVV